MALVGDPLRVGQVLDQFVQQRGEITEQGEIVVSTRVIEKREHRHASVLCSRHRDRLTEEQKGKLFQAFSQADSSTQEIWRDRAWIDHLQAPGGNDGGEIWIQSEAGKGASSFSLPPSAWRGKYRGSAWNYLGPQRHAVLVVEDNASSREILQTLLESMTFEFQQ